MTRKDAWLPSHLAILREHYPMHGSRYVAELIGKTPLAVSTQATIQKIKFIGSRKKPVSAAPSVTIRRRTGPALLPGDPVVTAKTRVTICPPMADPRFSNTHSSY